MTTRSPNLAFRLAESEDDLAALRPLSRSLHQEAYFSRYQYSFEKRDDLFAKAIATPDRFALMMAEWHHNPVGFLFCSAGDYIVGEGDLIVTVMSFYVDHERRSSLLGGRIALGLLRGVLRWAHNRNAREVLFHVTTGVDLGRTHQFLQKAGGRFIGGNYAFRINNADRGS